MKSIAIITARGGSKRIPKKNIRDFCGKPIIAYSIEAAINSKVYDVVMVSTDSEEIKSIAEQYGASVPFMRSQAMSDDYSTTSDVIAEVLGEYRKTGMEFDVFSCIYPTAVFVTASRLREAMESFKKNGADALVSVVKFGFPPQRAFVEKEGYISYQFPENERIRSQDLQPLFHDAGQFYICRIDKFMKEQSLILDRTIPYVLPEEEVQDIDDESDWKLAEIKYNNMLNINRFS